MEEIITSLEGVSVEYLEELKALTKKSAFYRRTWKKVAEFTLEEYAKVLPILRYASKTEDAEIVERKRKDGGTFLKAIIYIDGNDPLEFDLSYKHSFKKGNLLFVESLRICKEESLGDKHVYVTGEVI